MVVCDEADGERLRSADLRTAEPRRCTTSINPARASKCRTCSRTSRPSSARIPEFLASCRDGTLPDYSFVEPNYTDHDGDSGEILASDQHPDHHVREGDRFIGSIYNAIRRNESLWQTTALLIVYDEHGGLFDHVPPPACTPGGYEAKLDETGGMPFKFDRLGVRVPAVLVSPWVPHGTVVPSTPCLRARVDSGDGDRFLHRACTTIATEREKNRPRRFSTCSRCRPREAAGFLFADK